MHKFLIMVYQNDENGNKKVDTEPQYIYLDDSMKVRENYKRYRNQYQTRTDEETGEVIQTGIRMYTVELCEGTYVTKSKEEADAWVDSLIK